MRALLLAVLALGASSGALGLMQVCVETCPDDDDEGRCPADCTDCACCLTPTVITGAPRQIGVLPSLHTAGPACPTHVVAMYSQVDSTEIPHVPKHLRAS